jgi:hypothetical protein
MLSSLRLLLPGRRRRERVLPELPPKLRPPSLLPPSPLFPSRLLRPLLPLAAGVLEPLRASLLALLLRNLLACGRAPPPRFV